MALHGMNHGLWQEKEQSRCQRPWAGLLCGGETPEGWGILKGVTQQTGTHLEGEIGKPASPLLPVRYSWQHPEEKADVALRIPFSG